MEFVLFSFFYSSCLSLFQDDDNGWGLPIFQDTDVVWGDEDKETEVKRYFRAEYFTEDQTNQKSVFSLSLNLTFTCFS